MSQKPHSQLRTYTSVSISGEEHDLFGENEVGNIRSVYVEQTAGSATEIDIEIRYISTDSGISTLVYKNHNEPLPVQDDIVADALFDTQSTGDGRLVIYLEPNAVATLDVKVSAIMYR